MNIKHLMLTSLITFLILANNVSGKTTEFVKEREIFNNFSTVDPPAFCPVNHRVGNIVLAVKNNGTFGILDNGDNADCLTGDELRACEFPKNSRSQYLFGAAFWVANMLHISSLKACASSSESKYPPFQPQ